MNVLCMHAIHVLQYVNDEDIYLFYAKNPFLNLISSDNKKEKHQEEITFSPLFHYKKWVQVIFSLLFFFSGRKKVEAHSIHVIQVRK